ncbi:peptide-methionine (S)-S-oxide reductase MsrA [Roseivirga misakiensis]|nr:peptide-methionine (S)-S-oxide reductase MsrA [Roseivirga misakiensis]
MQLFYSIMVSAVLNLSMASCASDGKSELVVLNNLQDGEAIATFAGGCFWCTEAVFERVEGVNNVVSGYTGGKEENPTYYQVSYGKTTHAEGIQIYYDPKVITYQELLDIFFATHNPTELNRQGPDVGKQYRTAVYYHDDAQKKAVEATIAKLDKSGKYDKKIVTEVQPYDKFWLAEDYHQDYYELNPGNPYIINVAIPKVKKLKKYFPEKVKAKYKAER